jgi:hypothetical protein
VFGWDLTVFGWDLTVLPPKGLLPPKTAPKSGTVFGWGFTVFGRLGFYCVRLGTTYRLGWGSVLHK